MPRLRVSTFGRSLRLRKRLFLPKAVLLVTLSTATAFAAPAGSGTGVVKDASGAVIPNVRLTLVRVKTNEKFALTSGPD